MSTGRFRFIRNSVHHSPIVAALGTLDGVHLGHRTLIEKAVAAAKEENRTPAVITFYPHPLVGLGRVERMPALSSWRTKVRLLKERGVEVCIALNFRSIANLTAEQFLHYLTKQFSLHHLFVGSDLRIGKGRDGGISEIAGILSAQGVATTIIPLLNINGEKIGSRVIRDLIASGEIVQANNSLGRPYELEGRRVKGEERGTKIGIPTVNLYALRQVVPPNGVYHSTMRYNGVEYESVTNVGNRPTFGGTTQSIETHAIDVEISCPVGAHVQILFHDRIRAEMKFSGISELIAQIGRDISNARERTKGLGKKNFD